MTTSSEDRETLCLDDIKFSPGDHNHNGRDRDLLDRHLDSLSMSSSSSACSWDSSPSVSCTAFILKKEPSEDLEEDEEHEVRPSRFCMFTLRIFCSSFFALNEFIYIFFHIYTRDFYFLCINDVFTSIYIIFSIHDDSSDIIFILCHYY